MSTRTSTSTQACRMRAERLAAIGALVLGVHGASLVRAQTEPTAAPVETPETESPEIEPAVTSAVAEPPAVVAPPHAQAPGASGERVRWLLEEATRAIERGEPQVARYLLVEALGSGEAPSAAQTTTGAASPDPVATEPTEPSEEIEEVAAPSTHPWGRFVLEAGLVWGGAWVDGGMAADRARPSGLDELSPWTGCDARGEQCRVRVEQPGMGSTLAVRMALGVRPEPWLGVMLATRVQPDAGQGALAGWLIEAEVHLRALDLDAIDLDVIAALGAGRVQVQPAQDDVEGPYVRSGPGFAAVGLRATADIDSQASVVLDVRPRLGFPDLMFVIDAALAFQLRS